ncbi:3-methyl-2-oxobutanoate hydroxymethyltransferase [Peribacillus kribbensis]|uniref:3-methyl-2-oxobutanoate hydroxymethyltransferase n=1 Tax=Peribacillus kribbensis TaxID=356658 RepID=UPI0004021E7B|nr:3-methyl-2-oxobutanoate hydroxymethyltransferase [Peribacillus kribbensis]
MKFSAHFTKMKDQGEKITMLTAYDYPSAKTAEAAGVDMILVGDSLGMVVLGYDSTLPVTVEDMVHHTKAVKRGAPGTFIVTDMPFMSYHVSMDETMKNAAKIMQDGGCDALKLEGAGDVLEKISALSRAGVPVVSHLGLTPQSVGVLGGYKVQGKDLETARQLLEDAKACEEAGAVSLVLECVPYQLAQLITESLSIPVIGIGAGMHTDGQVLVYHDVITFGVDRLPKFAKAYMNAGESIKEALSQFLRDVKEGSFPELSHSFTMADEEVEALYGGRK